MCTQAEIIRALIETDCVALRCVKASVPFPAAWLQYTDSLRQMVDGTKIAYEDDGKSLPNKPAYPAGT